MKAHSTASPKAQSFAEAETPANNLHLYHFLSPLELAVYQHGLKQFTYYIDEEAIELEAHMAREIYYRSRKHVAALRAILQRARQKALRQNAQVRHFLQRPLQHHHLPARVYHVLKGNGCHNLADVANCGEPGLRRMRGMGNTGIRILVKLFNDNGCGNLFL